MKKRSLTALLAVAAASLAVAGGQALADPDSNNATSGLTSPALLALITNDDLFATADLALLLNTPGTNATQHYGPYASSSPDSGTCGNDWATDMFDRHFTVRANGDGTFTVVQQFKKGSFVTNSPTQPSPGSCDFADGSPPGTVNPGITGGMQGYFIISNVGPQTSNSPYCNAVTGMNANCTTTTFVNTHFTPCYPAACQVTTFSFHYSAGDQGLVEHEWKNASADRGGNHGDIRSTNVP
jgi:hypothetical protein